MPKIQGEGCPCTFKNQVSCLGNSSQRHSEPGLFSLRLNHLTWLQMLLFSFCLFGLLDTFSHLFFLSFFSPLFDLLCKLSRSLPLLSLFSLCLVLSLLTSYIILHQYVYLRSRAPHHCLCQTTEYEMGRTTKKKQLSSAQLCLRIVQYTCTYCHPVREGFHYNLRENQVAQNAGWDENGGFILT